MTQRDRDRLVVLKKAQKELITQRQAAEEIQVSKRHLRRVLVKLNDAGDRAVVHGLQGRPSNRRLSDKVREKAVRILSQEVYRGFGPTLASEYLAKKQHFLHLLPPRPPQPRGQHHLAQRFPADLHPVTNGGRGGTHAANCCSGTLPSTTGWRGAARSCT